MRAQLLELLARLYATPAPADQVIARHFRLRPSLPAGARGFLAATAYALQRRRLRTLALMAWAGRTEPLFDLRVLPPIATETCPLTPVEEAALALWRWMVEDCAATPEDATVLTLEACKLAAARELPPNEYPPPPVGQPGNQVRELAARYPGDATLQHLPADLAPVRDLSLPAEMVARWAARFGSDEAEAVGRSLGEPAPLDVRVNTLKMTVEECREALATAGHESAPLRWSPDGLRLAAKANLFRLPLFQDGAFEVQDEGSQLVALAMDPHPNWRVLDACSGGGGKSLHLAARMRNRGEVYAHDVDADRLDPQKKRLRRAGVHNVRILEPSTAAAHAPYDAVLIDAPCLGLGTLRRNPDLAWRDAMDKRLAAITTLQHACLESYAPLVKPGGVLLYATCSFEPEETTGAIASFIERHPEFARESLRGALERCGVAGLATDDSGELTLLPHRHGTDGFYIVRLRRAK